MIHAVDSESAQCKLAKTTNEKWKRKSRSKREKNQGKKRITKRWKKIKVRCHFEPANQTERKKRIMKRIIKDRQKWPGNVKLTIGRSRDR